MQHFCCKKSPPLKKNDGLFEKLQFFRD